jgi:PAS domain S-box-containing protein
MPKSDLDQFKDDVTKRLKGLTPFLTNYALGDFTESIEIPDEEDEFTELLVGLSLMIDDIREMIQDQEDTIAKLEEIEEDLFLKNTVFESSIASNSISSIDGEIIVVNPAFVKMWGFESKEDAVGNLVSDFFANEQDASQVVDSLNKTGEWKGEFRAKKQDGSTFTSRGFATAIHNKEGEPIGYQSTNIDISTEMEALENLNIEKEQFHNYIDSTGTIIVVINPDQTVRLMNKKGIQILGYQQEPVGLNWFKTFIPQNEQDMVSGVFDQMMAGEFEPVEYFENSILTKNGEERKIAWHNTVLVDARGNPNGTLSSGEDITDYTNTKDALEKSEALLLSAQRMARLGSWEWDIIQNKTVWSDELYRIFGVSPKDFDTNAYDAFINCIHAEDRELVVKTMETSMVDSKPFNIQYRIVRPDGSIRHVNALGEVSCDEKGKPIQMVGSTQDITESKQAEEAITQRVAELERFNQSMVGREKRMIELKGQINDLSQELGKKPPYNLSFLEAEKSE